MSYHHHSGEEKIRKVMGEFRAGRLRSSSGKKIVDKGQALAIAMSEAGMSMKMGRRRRKR